MFAEFATPAPGWECNLACEYKLDNCGEEEDLATCHLALPSCSCTSFNIQACTSAQHLATCDRSCFVHQQFFSLMLYVRQFFALKFISPFNVVKCFATILRCKIARACRHSIMLPSLLFLNRFLKLSLFEKNPKNSLYFSWQLTMPHCEVW